MFHLILQFFIETHLVSLDTHLISSNIYLIFSIEGARLESGMYFESIWCLRYYQLAIYLRIYELAKCRRQVTLTRMQCVFSCVHTCAGLNSRRVSYAHIYIIDLFAIHFFYTLRAPTRRRACSIYLISPLFTRLPRRYAQPLCYPTNANLLA